MPWCEIGLYELWFVIGVAPIVSFLVVSCIALSSIVIRFSYNVHKRLSELKKSLKDHSSEG